MLWLGLDASCPGTNRGVTATVRVQNREGVGRAGLAPHRHEDAAPPRQRIENPAVVRLKSNTPHRARQAEFLEVARTKRREQRTSTERSADAGEFDALRRRAQHALDERRAVDAVLQQDRQRLDRKAGLLERVDALLRPRRVLKHADRESFCIHVNHDV